MKKERRRRRGGKDEPINTSQLQEELIERDKSVCNAKEEEEEEESIQKFALKKVNN